MAKVLTEMNETAKAAAFAEHALQVDPTSAEAHFRLSTIYRQEHRIADSKHEIDEFQKYRDIKEKLRQIYREMRVQPQGEESEQGMGRRVEPIRSDRSLVLLARSHMLTFPKRSILVTTAILALGSVHLLLFAILEPSQMRASRLFANSSAVIRKRPGNESPPTRLPQLVDVTRSTGITFNHLIKSRAEVHCGIDERRSRADRLRSRWLAGHLLHKRAECRHGPFRTESA